MKREHALIVFKTVFKKLNYVSLFALALFSLSSCDNSTSDEFDEVNGNVEEKRLKEASVASTEYPEDNQTIYLNYDGDQRLSSITDGEETSVFVYNDGELSNITGGSSSVFNMEELYQSPYDAFETGQVIEYDDNGNPYILLFYEEEYNYETDVYDVLEYTAEITYDNVHNPHYYTLESAGLIAAMDKVQLNLSSMPQSPELIKAKLLFPNNNPSKIVYKNEAGVPVYQIDADYVYDEQDYPTSATVVATSLEDNETSIVTASFIYVE